MIDKIGLRDMLDKHREKQMLVRENIQKRNSELLKFLHSFNELAVHSIIPYFEEVEGQIKIMGFKHTFHIEVKRNEEGIQHLIDNVIIKVQVKNAVDSKKEDIVSFSVQEEPLCIRYLDSIMAKPQKLQLVDLNSEDKLKALIDTSLRKIFDQY